MLLCECKADDPCFHAFISRLMRECPPIIQRYSIAFFAEQFQKQKQCGSGVLLQLGGRHFVLTAAHVLDLHAELSLPIYLMTDEIGKRLASLDGATLYRSELPASRIRLDDPMDAGFAELTPRIVSDLGSNKAFLNLHDVEIRDPFHPKSWYMTAGYPHEENVSDHDRHSHISTLLAYASWPYNGERGVPENFRPGFDLFLHYLRDDSTEGDENVLATIPKPNGISGCGMWRLAEAFSPIESWTPKDIRLVGIQHSWPRQYEILRGVRVHHPLKMMATSLPLLVPCFQLNGMW